ncbi:hypothetical protein Ddc_24952 [Ditylenchus destructor]|nr:hypothetical protein Ddc_24952 [Ditylenchus destructor]
MLTTIGDRSTQPSLDSGSTLPRRIGDAAIQASQTQDRPPQPSLPFAKPRIWPSTVRFVDTRHWCALGTSSPVTTKLYVQLPSWYRRRDTPDRLTPDAQQSVGIQRSQTLYRSRPTLAANPAVSRLWRRDETRSALQPRRLSTWSRNDSRRAVRNCRHKKILTSTCQTGWREQPPGQQSRRPAKQVGEKLQCQRSVTSACQPGWRELTEQQAPPPDNVDTSSEDNESGFFHLNPSASEPPLQQQP